MIRVGRASDPAFFGEDTLMGLKVEELANEMANNAGAVAEELAALGTTVESLRIAEITTRLRTGRKQSSVAAQTATEDTPNDVE